MDNTQKLLEAAAGIRDAVLDGENTASRVGAMFVSIIQAMQHFPGQMVDASTVKVTNGNAATHITFNTIDGAGKTTAVDITVPAASPTTAGLLTPQQLEKYNTASDDIAAIKKRMPGSEKGLLLSGFRHGPTTEGVTFIFDAIGADGTIVPQQILVPLVSAGSPGVVTKAQMDALGTKADDAKAAANEAKSMAEGAGTAANEAKVTAHSASVAAQEAKGTASQAKSTAEGAATTANAAQIAADGAAKGVRDINAVVGEPDGIATLGTDGKVPVEQVPALGYLPLTKVVAVDTQAHIEESIDLGYTGAGLYFVTDYNYGEGAFCRVTVTDGAVDFDDDGAQPAAEALRGYFLETSTGTLWQMVRGRLERVPTKEALTDVTEKAKMALYVDLWTRGYDCGYDASKGKPFSCNKVPLTYEESIAVYNAPRMMNGAAENFTMLTPPIKTIILGTTKTMGTQPSIFNAFRSQSLEVVRVSADENDSISLYSDITHAFNGCANLVKILGTIGFVSWHESKCDHAFDGCVKLEEVRLYNLRKDVSFADSPVLSLATLQYLVTNAANTEGITVTVHGNVYAKLTGETTNAAAAALSAEELAQWQAVATAAAGKNITFATV